MNSVLETDLQQHQIVDTTFCNHCHKVLSRLTNNILQAVADPYFTPFEISEVTLFGVMLQHNEAYVVDYYKLNCTLSTN